MARGEILAQLTLEGENKFISGIRDSSDEMEDASDSAGIFNGSLGRVADKLSDVIPGLNRFTRNVDEAGDEAAESGGKARRAARAFASLAVSTEGVSGRVGVASGSLGKIAGILGTVLVVLAPVGALLGTLALGFTAVAGAMGAVIGTGILAFGKKQAKQNKKQLKQTRKKIKRLEKLKDENDGLTKSQQKQLKSLEKQEKKLEDSTTAMGGFSKALKDVGKEIQPLIVDFGEKFAPLIEDALNALPGLVKNIIDAIPPLDKFRNALRQLGQKGAKFLPKLIGFFFELAQWALPIFVKFANFIMANLVPALQKFTDRGKAVWQMLSKASKHGKTLWKWLKSLVKQFKKASKKGTPLQEKVAGLATAAKRFWKNLKPVLKALKPLVKELVKAAPVFAKLALDVGKLAFQIGSKLVPFLKPVIDFATAAVKWFNQLAPPVRRTALVIGGLAAGLLILIPMLKAAALAVLAMTFPISATTLAIIGLGIAVVALADYIYKHWDQIVKWTKSLASDVMWWMDRIATGINDAITGAIDGVVKWLKGAAKTDVVGALKSMGSAVAGAFKSAFNAAMPDAIGIPRITIGGGVPGPDYSFGGGSLNLPQLDTGGFIQSGGLAMLHSGERVVPKAQVNRGGGGGGPEQIVVKLDADATKDMLRGEAIDAFDQRISDVQRKQKRRRGAR